VFQQGIEETCMVEGVLVIDGRGINSLLAGGLYAPSARGTGTLAGLAPDSFRSNRVSL